MDLVQVVRENIIMLRDKKGWTQDELAIQVDKSRSWVTHVESGRSKISAEHIGLFAKVFGVSPSYMLSEHQEIRLPRKIGMVRADNSTSLIESVKESLCLTTIPSEGELDIFISGGRVRKLSYVPADFLNYTLIPAEILTEDIIKFIEGRSVPITHGTLCMKYGADKDVNKKNERKGSFPFGMMDEEGEKDEFIC